MSDNQKSPSEKLLDTIEFLVELYNNTEPRGYDLQLDYYQPTPDELKLSSHIDAKFDPDAPTDSGF